MDDLTPKRLTEEQSELVFRRALELQELARKTRTQDDVMATLRELGVESAYVEQALAELAASNLVEPPVGTRGSGSVKAPARGRGRRAVRGLAVVAALSLTVAGTAAWYDETTRIDRERQMVSETTEQLIQRQDFYLARNGEYAADLEDLGELPFANIELIGGGESYLARVSTWRTGAWCQVTFEVGKEPQRSCGRTPR